MGHIFCIFDKKYNLLVIHLFLNTSTIQAKVRILPECVLGHPLEGVEPVSVHRVRSAAEQTTLSNAQTSGDGAGDVAALLQNFLTHNKPRKVRFTRLCSQRLEVKDGFQIEKRKVRAVSF